MDLPKRKDVSTSLTWDLTHLYATEEDMLADHEAAKTLCRQLVEQYKGKLTTPEKINACLDAWQALAEKMDLVGNYCGLAAAVDYYDAKLQERQSMIQREQAQMAGKFDFIESELSEADESLLWAAMEATASNRHYLAEILRKKPHRLDAKTEETLTRLSATLEAPYELYHVVKLTDMKFDPFVVDGVEYPLGYSLFEDDYEYDARTDVRRGAFHAFSDKLRQYENITAAIYNTQVQREKTMADLRGFESVFDSMLFGQKVSREIYDRQIDLIMEHLAPHMRRYAKLIQRIHHLDKMTYADLKLPVDSDYNPKITIAEAEDYLARGLSPLGEDYVEMVHEAFRDRRIDFARNQGTETGGFCASPYQKNSYILLTWNERMSDVLTLAHELGHAGHFRLASANQSWFDTYDQDFIVEAPSTTNEIIMAHYLLKTNQDKRFRRWVLSCMISNTYYHNFVTHLLEAAYQREVYKIVDAGGSVQAATLNRIMRETLEKFWGDEVELTEGAELTWMRQPHYYMQLYSYVYSAGLTIGTQMCRRIETEGDAALTDWKKALAAGGTLSPEEFAAAAGVDLTSRKPLMDTIDYIGEMIDETIRLTEDLEASSVPGLL
ncbi:MAG: oligoendopeptidase F [Clostridiales bacterium]|nr:oligoendopeptidase F [Clostridiales bacterium]